MSSYRGPKTNMPQCRSRTESWEEEFGAASRLALYSFYLVLQASMGHQISKMSAELRLRMVPDSPCEEEVGFE